MTYLLATSARHIKGIRGNRKKLHLKEFPSGEMRIVISDDVAGENVFLVGSVLPDANSLLELLIAADLLKRKGSRVQLVILYFAYARQDKPDDREPFTAKIVCQILQTAGFEKTYVMDVHSAGLKRFLGFENVIPVDLFSKALARVKNPVIVAPDRGGVERAQAVARLMNAETACIQKERLGSGKVRSFNLEGDVKGHHAIIVDDMIDTGGTIIGAARLLKACGARDVYVVATHGVFSMDAITRLQASPIKAVIVTNTLPPVGRTPKIKVVKIEPVINSLFEAAAPRRTGAENGLSGLLEDEIAIE